MSIEALKWAFELPVPGHYKSTLLAVANYADDEGVCRWKSAKRIATIAGRSEGTVRRLWRELEEIGVLARIEQMRRDGKGQASNELRLNLGMTASDLIARLTERGIAADDDSGDDQDDPAPQGDSVTTPPITGEQGAPITGEHPPLVTSEQGPLSPAIGERIHLESSSPPKPPLASEAGPQGLSEEGQEDESVPLHRFRVSYPIPILKPDLCRTIWHAMSADEREQAIEGARGYARFLERERRRAMDAHKWLRERLWTQFAGRQSAPGERVFVVEGTESEAAWIVAYQLRGYRDLPGFLRTIRNGERGLLVPSEYPPIGRGLPRYDRETWVFVPHGDNRWWAWRERLIKEFGEGVRFISRHKVGDADCEGAWFPSDWPPAKGATGPPADQPTADDIDALANTG